jgi:hypothetical protein
MKNIPSGQKIIARLVKQYPVIAVGSEEGAMTVHFRCPFPSWRAYAVEQKL